MIRNALVATLIVAGFGLAAAPLASANFAGYANCSAAHADGRYDIPEGDPDYKSGQDRDGDGVACES